MPLYYKAGCNSEKGDASDAGQWEEYKTFTFIKANVHNCTPYSLEIMRQCSVLSERDEFA